jgi:C1A family cysteine protease
MSEEHGLGCLEASSVEIGLVDSVCTAAPEVSGDIPDTLNARKWLRVNDQGRRNSCCGNAVDKALEWSRWAGLDYGDHPEDLSARWSYLAALEWAQTLYRGDNGVSIEAGVMASRDVGAVLESEFPYWRESERFDTELPSNLMQRAGLHRVRSVARATTGEEVIQRLGAGIGATVFGMYWSSEMSNYRGGILDRVPGGRNLGGHAVCAVDYEQSRGIIWVANSHGEQWGDRGWFAVTVDTMTALLSQPFGAYTVSGVMGFTPRRYRFKGFMA